jgi:histidine triad (HIT) family protein
VNDPDCLFCQIVLGQRPAHVVLESAHALAFLDVRPLFPGHSLLVPRDHYVTLADLPTPLVGDLFVDVQRLASAVEAAMEAAGTFVAANNRVSQSVPHFHVHVVPRRPKDGLRGFFWPRQKYETDEQMSEVAARIRAQVAGSDSSM